MIGALTQRRDALLPVPLLRTLAIKLLPPAHYELQQDEEMTKGNIKALPALLESRLVYSLQERTETPAIEHLIISKRLVETNESWYRARLGQLTLTND